MIKIFKNLIKISNIFKKYFNWSDDRAEKAMMRELFSELLQYCQKDITEEFTKKKSRRIDCLQQILDDWE